MQDADFLHNFHTHTFRCKHAIGDVADYCREAQARGMLTLGMSDHCAWPDDRWLDVRMAFDELDDYVRVVRDAQAAFPSLNVLLGMECEFVPKYRAYLEDELLGERGFDYLIGGAHYYPDPGRNSADSRSGRDWSDDEWVGTYGGTTNAHQLNAYAAHVVDMMESGLFAFIAHPDLFGNCYANWDANTKACSRDIIAASQATGVPLEVNALGLRKQAKRGPNAAFPLYPWRPFWELCAEYDAPVIVNADAHSPADLQGMTSDAHAIAAEFELKVVDPAVIGQRS